MSGGKNILIVQTRGEPSHDLAAIEGFLCSGELPIGNIATADSDHAAENYILKKHRELNLVVTDNNGVFIIARNHGIPCLLHTIGVVKDDDYERGLVEKRQGLLISNTSTTPEEELRKDFYNSAETALACDERDDIPKIAGANNAKVLLLGCSHQLPASQIERMLEMAGFLAGNITIAHSNSEAFMRLGLGSEQYSLVLSPLVTYNELGTQSNTELAFALAAARKNVPTLVYHNSPADNCGIKATFESTAWFTQFEVDAKEKGVSEFLMGFGHRGEWLKAQQELSAAAEKAMSEDRRASRDLGS